MNKDNLIKHSEFKSIFPNINVWTQWYKEFIIERMFSNDIPDYMNNEKMVFDWNIIYYSLHNKYYDWNCVNSDDKTKHLLANALTQLMPNLYLKSLSLDKTFLSQLTSEKEQLLDIILTKKNINPEENFIESSDQYSSTPSSSNQQLKYGKDLENQRDYQKSRTIDKTITERRHKNILERYNRLVQLSSSNVLSMFVNSIEISSLFRYITKEDEKYLNVYEKEIIIEKTPSEEEIERIVKKYIDKINVFEISNTQYKWNKKDKLPLDMNQSRITELNDPISDDNAVNKKYVDKAVKDVSIDNSGLQDKMFRKSSGGSNWSKIDDLPLEMNDSKIIGLSDPIEPLHASNKRYVDKAVKDVSIDKSGLQDKMFRKSSGGSNWNKIDVLPLEMNDSKIIGLSDPVEPLHATNKRYVDKAVKDVKIDTSNLQDKIFDMSGGMWIKKDNKIINFSHSNIDGLADPEYETQAANKKYVDNNNIFKKSTGGREWSKKDELPLGMNQSRISELKDPEADDDAATKSYVDGMITKLKYEKYLNYNSFFNRLKTLFGTSNKDIKIIKRNTHLQFIFIMGTEYGTSFLNGISSNYIYGRVYWQSSLNSWDYHFYTNTVELWFYKDRIQSNSPYYPVKIPIRRSDNKQYVEYKYGEIKEAYIIHNFKLD